MKPGEHNYWDQITICSNISKSYDWIPIVFSDNVQKGQTRLKSRLPQYFNTVYQRTSALWEGRYKATIFHSEEYLMTCYRYIELNPVRANMVKHPRHYPWSSYCANALSKDDSLVTPHDLYRALGTQPHQRQAAY